jgi:taurine dioxygenase
MTTSRVEIHPVTPAIGAEVTGVRIDQPIDVETAASLRQALLNHLVLFFRGRELTPAQFQDFAAVFGEVTPGPPYVGKLEEFPMVHLVDNDGSTVRGAFADTWHADYTAVEEPPKVTMVTPSIIPAVGGDTLWANMYAAYETLSPGFREYLDPLDAEHLPPAAVAAAGGGGRVASDTPVVGAVHPVVRVHPETGRRSIYANENFARRILGVHISESSNILNFLRQHCAAPEFQVRWRWKNGDVAVWDNRCTIHYGVVDYHKRRVLHRLILKGDRPVGPRSQIPVERSALQSVS